MACLRRSADYEGFLTLMAKDDLLLALAEPFFVLPHFGSADVWMPSAAARFADLGGLSEMIGSNAVLGPTDAPTVDIDRVCDGGYFRLSYGWFGGGLGGILVGFPVDFQFGRRICQVVTISDLFGATSENTGQVTHLTPRRKC